MKHIFQAIFPLRFNKTLKQANARAYAARAYADEFERLATQSVVQLLTERANYKMLAEDYADLLGQHEDLTVEAADLRAHLLHSTDLTPLPEGTPHA